MARTLTSTLIEAEREWRESSPEWKRKLEKWEKWKEAARERARRVERVQRDKTRSAADEERFADDQSWESSFNPDDPSPQFSFVGSYASFSRSDLEDEIRSLRWRSAGPEWAFAALRRGIAVHHSGMNKAYRSLVERYAVLPINFTMIIMCLRLFRLRFLQVVVATGD